MLSSKFNSRLLTVVGALLFVFMGRSEEIVNGIWSAQLHAQEEDYDIIGSFRKEESRAILNSFIKADVGRPGHLRSLSLVLKSSEGKAATATFGCIHHLPESSENNPGCRIFASWPFEEKFGEHFDFTTDEDTAIRLTRYLKANTTPEEDNNGFTYKYELGNEQRVSFKCVQKSAEHFPTCNVKVLNSFNSYNFHEPGRPDNIELPSNGRVLLDFTTFGNVPNSIAQTFQRLLPVSAPIEGDTPGRIINEIILNGEGQDNEGWLWCNQYPTAPGDFDIRTCIMPIEKKKNSILPFKLPLNVTFELTNESSRSLSSAIGTEVIEGTTFARSAEVGPNYDPVVPSRMRLECKSEEACVVNLSQDKR